MPLVHAEALGERLSETVPVTLSVDEGDELTQPETLSDAEGDALRDGDADDDELPVMLADWHVEGV